MNGEKILVDGFYCLYRSAYAFQDFRTKDGRNSGLLFGFVRTLISIKQKWPSAEIVVCWDSPSSWRKEAYSEYKGNRANTKSVMDRNQIYDTAEYCKQIGINQAHSPGFEADDVIGSSIDRTCHNIIFSRDQDFCQLVEDGIVSIYSPKSGDVEEKIFDEKEVLKKFGVIPKKVLLYRVFRGDSSDNLPGIPRFPSKKIIELVEKNESVGGVFNTPNVILTDHQKKALAEFHDQALLNWKLMRILTDIQVRLVPGMLQKHKALEILDKYELKSLRSSLSLFDGQEPEEEDLGFFA